LYLKILKIIFIILSLTGIFGAQGYHFVGKVMAATPSTPICVGEEKPKRPGKKERLHQYERDPKKRKNLHKKKLKTLLKICLQLHVECGEPIFIRSRDTKGEDCGFMSPDAMNQFAPAKPMPTVAELEVFFEKRLNYPKGKEKAMRAEKRKDAAEIIKRSAYDRDARSYQASQQSSNALMMYEYERVPGYVANLTNSIIGPGTRYDSYKSVFGDVDDSDDEDESSDEGD